MIRRPFTHLVITTLATSALTGCQDTTPPMGIARPMTPQPTEGVVADTTPPVITYSLNGTLGQNGWYASEPVIVTFTITDPESPAVPDPGTCLDFWTSTPGWRSTMEPLCIATSAGGTSQLAPDILVDTWSPKIKDVYIKSSQSAPGWWNTDVLVGWTCVDFSGDVRRPPSGAVESNPTKTLSTEGANQRIGATCADSAGNRTDDPLSFLISIDKTPPSLAPTISPNPVLLNGSATVLPNASDALSGLASVQCRPVETSSVGRKSLLCIALDSAINETDKFVDYIVAWPFAGFVGLNAAPALNPAKTGGSVQVKFSLGGNRGLAILEAGSPTSQPISCGTSAAAATALKAPTGAASSLSYNARTDTYTFDWKTDKSWAGTCRQLSVKLVDGTERTLNFQFAK
jgi:hypothetical protein